MSPSLLDFQHVTVRRGPREALRDISFQAHVGESVALMGPNGSGKSTLLKLITRECYPSSHPGRVFSVNGQESWNVFELRHLLGIVSNDWQDKFARPISGEEIVLSGFFNTVGIWPADRVTKEMKEKAREILSFLGISHLSDRSMRDMSSGEARRFLIGRALVNDPKVLVLDEPSNSLDLRATHDFQMTLQRISALGKTIILATHHLHDIIPEIGRVVLLKAGAILFDGPKVRALTSERISGLFEMPLKVEKRGEFYFSWSSL